MIIATTFGGLLLFLGIDSVREKVKTFLNREFDAL